MLPGFLLLKIHQCAGIRNGLSKLAGIRNVFCGFEQLLIKAGLDKLDRQFQTNFMR